MSRRVTKNKNNDWNLTSTFSAVSCESCPTNTLKRAHGVITIRVSGTVMRFKGTFIGIYIGTNKE